MRLLLSFIVIPAFVFSNLFGQAAIRTSGSITGLMDEYSSHTHLMAGFTNEVTLQESHDILLSFYLYGMRMEESDFQGVHFLMASLLSPDADGLKAAANRLLQHPAVKWVYPVLLDANGHFWGITDKIYAKALNSAKRDSVLDFLNKTGCKNIQEYQFDPSVICAELDKTATMGPVEIANHLAGSGWVEFAQPDYAFSPAVATNDTFFKYQWNIRNDGTAFQGSGTPGADMQVEDAWMATTGDSNTLIGIIDSGTDTLHPDLINRLLPGFDATGGNKKGYPNTNFPEDGHGTSTAGIAGAEAGNSIGISGVCPDCRILPVRVFYYAYDTVFGLIPWSTGTWMADGINWAWQNGADVLSNSWGMYDWIFPFLPGGTVIADSAIESAYKQGRGGLGTLSIFSSGNDNAAPLWPGRNLHAIAVNATSMCDERKTATSCDGENWAGNFGDSLDISAPGVRIATTDFTGSNGYNSGDYIFDFGGTSASAPNAAAVLGLILSEVPTATAKEAREALERGCDKTGGYSYGTSKQNGTWSTELGYGRVNALTSLLIATDRAQQPKARSKNLNVFPNPASEFFFVSVKMRGILEITDMQGRELAFFHLDSNQEKIDVSKLPSGIYILTAILEGNTERGKLQVIR